MELTKIEVSYYLDENLYSKLETLYREYCDRYGDKKTIEVFFNEIMALGSNYSIEKNIESYHNLLETTHPLVEELLEPAEREEFLEYLKECLSCDFAEMTEAQRRRAYNGWRKSRCIEDGFYSPEFFIYENDGRIYDRETGDFIAPY